MRGVHTAKRINGLVDELKLEISKRVFIINRISGNEGNDLERLAEELGLTVTGLVPQDDALVKLDIRGEPVFNLPEDSRIVREVFRILDSLEIP
jgi:CO dehydrogenase maturation factor